MIVHERATRRQSPPATCESVEAAATLYRHDQMIHKQGQGIEHGRFYYRYR
jgi:hypothetical protein